VVNPISDEEKEKLKDLVNRNKSEIDDSELTSLTKNALKRKYQYPEWGLFFEVTGKNGRRVDAVAYNLFPSRNWKTIGLEVKVSRSDWKKELKEASKNDWFVGQVDQFYVVAGRKGIVRESELPDGWGLLEMKGGGKLYEVVESQLTEHQDRPIDKEFYMRGVKKAVEKAREARLSKKRAKRESFRKGKKAGKKEGDISREQKKMIEKGEKFEKLEESLDASLYLLGDDKIEKFNKALNIVDLVDSDSFGGLKSDLSGLVSRHQNVGEKIDELLETMDDLDETLTPNAEKGLERFEEG